MAACEHRGAPRRPPWSRRATRGPQGLGRRAVASAGGFTVRPLGPRLAPPGEIFGHNLPVARQCPARVYHVGPYTIWYWPKNLLSTIRHQGEHLSGGQS